MIWGVGKNPHFEHHMESTDQIRGLVEKDHIYSTIVRLNVYVYVHIHVYVCVFI